MSPAASSIEALVVTFEDTSNPGPPHRANPPSLAYELFIQQDIRTLSANTNGNNDIEGFLYTPDFPADSPCVDQTAQYIPQNVTRRADLPGVDGQLPLIALAPWTIPDCILPLLAAARNRVTAFIFYLPDSPVGIPPPVSDPVWVLGDGGSWKAKNKHPVYAISGPQGRSVMTQLARYSGALSDAPNGTLLQEQQDVASTARMYAIVTLASATSLPSLWAFLLIVLGIVLFLIGLTSGVMHLWQRRRRNALRQRIVNGEVDLEQLGIKRLTVPQEAINMLPQFIYSPSEKELLDRPKDHVTALSDFPAAQSDTQTTDSGHVVPLAKSTDPPIPALPQQAALSKPASLELQNSPPPTSNPVTLPKNDTSPNQPTYAQPTCPICLDDFIPQATTVRSLPCHHIYHPECIDPFLLRNSSLCPVCKSKVLPKGYCPAAITNAMVRRERQQRRNRDRVRRIRGEEAAAQMPVANLVEPRRGRLLAVQGRMADFQRQIGRGPRTASAQIPPVEMRSLNGEVAVPAPAGGILNSEAVPSAPLPPSPRTAFPPPPPPSSQPASSNSNPSGPEPRSERARRRASLFMRAQEPTVEEQEMEHWSRLPRWRKAIKSLFPGF
ncbi:MAG: hypothetical protein Q9210_004728 [Variospora velana]